ncbi:TonB-dependent receptor [Ignavibacterium sp.]|uniref:TonB-dependent receptor n=1 Tax=Ignavibacterium sp. TaxID=2651167 RepID=UPI00307E8053
MFPKLYKVLIILMFAVSFVHAQNGRISGAVTDKQTGEPLIGANIIVVGTTFGAAANVNGEYIINNIPAGNYTVKASYIGYQDVTVSNLIVNSGLTTRLNFELTSSQISTEEVVIISQRPLIEKTSTNAKRIVDNTQVEALGFRGLQDAVSLLPGVVQQNGRLFIRGSRPDETGYTVEGADVKDVLNRNGGSLVNVIPDAVQEVSVQAGGYTAEYGNANAGIVSSEFKTGTNNFHFSFRSETDNFGNYPGEKFLGTYSYGYSSNVFTVSGPTFTDKLKFFLSGENTFSRDVPRFFSANPSTFSDGALWDTTKIFDTGVFGGDKNEYRILNWGNANLPGNMNNRYTANGTLLFDSNPLFLRLAGAFSRSQTQGMNNIINIFNTDRLAKTDISTLLLNLKGTYLLGSNSFIEGLVGFYDYRGKTFDPVFEDDFLSYSDSLAAAKHGWTFSNYFSDPADYDFYGFPFSRPGANLVGYTKDHNNYLTASLAYTGQIGIHALKVGGSYQRYTVRRWQVGNAGNFLSTVRNNPDLARDSLSTLISTTLFANFNNYGFDVFGNETDEEGLFAPKHPVFASAYIVDRIEISDLIINAGLRFDHIDMDSWAWEDPRLPVFDTRTNLIPDSAIRSGDKFNFVSPRLGFAFPISDKTVFHLQYGKFVQAPSLDIAYRGVFIAAQQLRAANLFTNPIAYNPNPIRTTQYEVGFGHQFSDFAAFDITAFYKDIKGQIQYAVIPTAPGAFRANYSAFVNQDFATNKGIELSLKLRRVSRVSGSIDYTFSSAEGTNSLSNSGLGSVEVNRNVPTVLIPLDYNQTHRGSIFLDYRFDKDDGGPILERLGFNLLLTFNSGHPFTYSQWTGLGQSSAWTGGLTPIGTGDTRGRRPIGPINSAKTPWVYNIDFRIDKTVTIYNLDVNFYIQVFNLLNTKSVINVYDKTGNAFDDGFLSTTDAQTLIQGDPARYERFADLYRAINLENRQAAFQVYGFDLFGSPRQLRIGVWINY